MLPRLLQTPAQQSPLQPADQVKLHSHIMANEGATHAAQMLHDAIIDIHSLPMTDFTLQSKDGKTFDVHKSYLAMYSGFFDKMFPDLGLADARSTGERDDEATVSVDECAHDLEILVFFVYNPSEISYTRHGCLDPIMLREIATLADKYDMPVVIHRCDLALAAAWDMLCLTHSSNPSSASAVLPRAPAASVQTRTFSIVPGITAPHRDEPTDLAKITDGGSAFGPELVGWVVFAHQAGLPRLAGRLDAHLAQTLTQQQADDTRLVGLGAAALAKLLSARNAHLTARMGSRSAGMGHEDTLGMLDAEGKFMKLCELWEGSIVGQYNGFAGDRPALQRLIKMVHARRLSNEYWVPLAGYRPPSLRTPRQFTSQAFTQPMHASASDG